MRHSQSRKKVSPQGMHLSGTMISAAGLDRVTRPENAKNFTMGKIVDLSGDQHVQCLETITTASERGERKWTEI
ncbi:MAG: hypothetical protein WBB85_13825 [Albidovulum sp.]|uniref:hypothetical protein n=1 Tax=Albidovulum sp. TaxID=1872424 RepID=UPI003CA3BA27